MKRHVFELVGAVLLCLAALFIYAARSPISLPFIGTGSSVASSPEDWPPDFLAIPMLQVAAIPQSLCRPLHEGGYLQ